MSSGVARRSHPVSVDLHPRRTLLALGSSNSGCGCRLKKRHSCLNSHLDKELFFGICSVPHSAWTLGLQGFDAVVLFRESTGELHPFSAPICSLLAVVASHHVGSISARCQSAHCFSVPLQMVI